VVCTCKPRQPLNTEQTINGDDANQRTEYRWRAIWVLLPTRIHETKKQRRNSDHGARERRYLLRTTTLDNRKRDKKKERDDKNEQVMKNKRRSVAYAGVGF
jgi:hypothetical protein